MEELIRIKYISRFAYGNSLLKEDTPTASVKAYGSNGPYALTDEPNTLSPVIIVGRKGSYGKINWSSEPCFASDTTFFIDSRFTAHNLRWLYYGLQTLGLDQGSNEAAIPGLNRETAYNYKLPLLSLDQEYIISDYLDNELSKIDLLIATKEKLISLLSKKKQEIIIHTVTKGLNPRVNFKKSSIEWLDEIPKHWELKKVKYITELQSGDFIPSELIRDEDLYPVFGGNGLRGYTHEKNRSGEFVLIGRQGALCGNINYADGEFWATEHAIVCSPIQKYDTIWLGELLRIMNLNQYSIAAAQPGLSVDVIKNLLIPVPDFYEQQKIVEYLKEETTKIDKISEATQKSINLLRERREALISSAVTGQIEIITS